MKTSKKVNKEIVIGFRVSDQQNEKLQAIATKEQRTIGQLMYLWAEKLIKRGKL
jgi:hypothetical protein